MTSPSSGPPATSGAGILHERDALVMSLDSEPLGEALTAGDWVRLVLLGLVVPALLLVWGWR